MISPNLSALRWRLIISFLMLLFIQACPAPPKMRLSRAELVRPDTRIEREALAPAPVRPNTQIEQQELAVSSAQQKTKIEQQALTPVKGDQVIGRLAVVLTRDGDTLPDIARHFGLGHEEIIAANPDVDVWAPQAGSRVLLPRMHVLPDSVSKGIVVNLAAMRLFHYRAKGSSYSVSAYPIGIGDEGRSTPTGGMSVVRKAVRPTWYVPASIRRDHQERGDPLPSQVPPGPDNPLGGYALYLNRASYVIHGTNKPYSIGLRATNGCIRLYPEDIEKLYPASSVKTPVHIVNQPYLIGHSGGMLYLEAHTPQEELNAGDMKKRLYSRLREIEKKEEVRLDWKRIEETVKQARGIPVPVLEGGGGLEEMIADAVEMERPSEWFGQPRVPAMKSGLWYIRVDEMLRESNAQKLAAVLSHQGPPIPSRVLPKGERYQVVAGPYKNQKAAAAAVKRLKSDLDLDGAIIRPAKSRELALDSSRESR